VLQAHYSIKGAAAVTGIGVDNCFVIETDAAGRMIPEALEAKIIESKRDGLHPFFVGATAGTTVYGAFDPLPLIADICERHELWMHVDVSVRAHARAQNTCTGRMGWRTAVVESPSTPAHWHRTGKFGHMESTQADGCSVAMFGVLCAPRGVVWHSDWP